MIVIVDVERQGWWLKANYKQKWIKNFKKMSLTVVGKMTANELVVVFLMLY